MSDVVLGFDPGGQKKFGWAVCENTGERLRVLKTSVANDAHETITKVSEVLPEGARIAAAGIDAPLFWGKAGNRKVDELVRAAVAERGHVNASGTVQQVNSLWGACLVQGILLGDLLHQRFPEASITEAHPKALLWLLGLAAYARPAESLTLHDLSEWIDGTDVTVSEHERDGVLAAFAAWSMSTKSPGWRDLLESEPSPVQPLGTPVSYWMPLP